MKSNRVSIALLFARFTALVCLAPSISAEESKPILIKSKRIWNKAPYNSFTDLTLFRNQWFCCFREGIAQRIE